MRTKLNEQKKQHRERGQLAHRRKLGLLEKHSDYVKRARDYHSKEDRIRKLRQKAASRNKDEFYFGMIRSRTEGGIHIQDRGNSPMPVDVVKLLKTQDAGYVRTLLATEEKLIGKLRDTLGSTVGLLPDKEEEQKRTVDSDSEDDDDDADQHNNGTRQNAVGPSKKQLLSLINDASAATSSSSSSSSGSLSASGSGTAANASTDNKGKKTYFVDSDRALEKFKLQVGNANNKSKGQASTAASSQSNDGKKKKKKQTSTKTNAKGKGKQQTECDPAVDDDDFTNSTAHAKSSEEERMQHISDLAEELQARLERLQLLKRTFREMQVQRAVMGKGSRNVVGNKKKKKGVLDREGARLNEDDLDELELKRLGNRKAKLPEPEQGVRTGARVWKWKAERKR